MTPICGCCNQCPWEEPLIGGKDGWVGYIGCWTDWFDGAGAVDTLGLHTAEEFESIIVDEAFFGGNGISPGGPGVPGAPDNPGWTWKDETVGIHEVGPTLLDEDATTAAELEELFKDWELVEADDTGPACAAADEVFCKEYIYQN